ncbi:Uncharacterised protein [Mycobacterium tuberculosis]|nr:Uncharacterised protein [Mycobacterium tuberculosis]CNM92531.1 Uncharacterised protein [Mycobacterium tuberculosis]COW85051.1 Uncharacterised protein [Mycobacterium tuberculosis]SGO04252.1 Uncharacterised protein [Mycobacterium tuberculosis]
MPLSDITLGGTHQTGYRQAVITAQLPADREPLPVRGQRRGSGRSEQASRDVGTQSCPRRDRAQGNGNRAAGLVGRDAECADWMGARAQFTHHQLKRGLQRLPLAAAAQVAATPAVAQAECCAQHRDSHNGR